MTFQKIAAIGCISTVLVIIGIHIWSTDLQTPQSASVQDPVGEHCHHNTSQIPPARRFAKFVEKRCAESFGTELEQHLDISSTIANQILVNEPYRFMVCYVPKVASSNIKRLFLVLGHMINTSDTSNINSHIVQATVKEIKTLKSYPLSAINYRLRHYTKVMVTREPFERLVSAYKSKFESGIKVKDPLSLRLRAHALTVLNAGKQNGFRNDLTELSFVNYVRFLVNQTKANVTLNQHFASQINLCDPCSVGYDHIIKYENIDDGLQLVLNEVDIDGSVKFPGKEDYYKSRTATRDLLHKYYDTVPSGLKRQLWKYLTAKDAALFGYNVPDALVNFLD